MHIFLKQRRHVISNIPSATFVAINNKHVHLVQKFEFRILDGARLYSSRVPDGIVQFKVGWKVESATGSRFSVDSQVFTVRLLDAAPTSAVPMQALALAAPGCAAPRFSSRVFTR